MCSYSHLPFGIWTEMKGDLQGHADHFRRESRGHSLVTPGSSSECFTQEPSTHWLLPGGGSLRLESMVHSAPRCSPWEDKERGETSWCRQGMKSCVLWETGLYLSYSIKEDITKTCGGETNEVRFGVLGEKVLLVPQAPRSSTSLGNVETGVDMWGQWQG